MSQTFNDENVRKSQYIDFDLEVREAGLLMSEKLKQLEACDTFDLASVLCRSVVSFSGITSVWKLDTVIDKVLNHPSTAVRLSRRTLYSIFDKLSIDVQQRQLLMVHLQPSTDLVTVFDWTPDTALAQFSEMVDIVWSRLKGVELSAASIQRALNELPVSNRRNPFETHHPTIALNGVHCLINELQHFDHMSDGHTYLAWCQKSVLLHQNRE